MTYLVAAWAGTGLMDRPIECSDTEVASFPPPSGQTCAEYLTQYFEAGAPGYLFDPDSTTLCQYCPLSTSEQFLARSSIYPSDRWRDYGIGWAYIIFNVSHFSSLFL